VPGSCQNNRKAFVVFGAKFFKTLKKAIAKLVRKAYELILTVTLETKLRFGHREFAAAHVQGLLQATDKESERFVYSR
jgi:hypothetical protein